MIETLITDDELRATGNAQLHQRLARDFITELIRLKKRLNQHADTAQRLIEWFLKQPFVTNVLSPTLETSPYHKRFQHYFGKGNGLFSVVFLPDLLAEHVEAFVDALNLFWVAESWGGHLSLVLPV
ncbi:PLP-dependent transferase, partial [Pelosinus baikalensis]